MPPSHRTHDRHPEGRPLPIQRGASMSAREAEFCRRQAERLQRLAEECVDAEIRKQIREMAAEWAEGAKQKPLLQSVK
jgi:hypothetical protein